jgi:hypothetical protein
MFPVQYKAGGLAVLVCAVLLTPRAQASILVSFVSDINTGIGGVLSYGSDGSAGFAVSGGGSALAGPVQALWGPGGRIYVSSIGTGEILRYDGLTGAYLDTFVSGIAHDTSGGFDVGPLGMAFGPNGDLYVTNDFTNEVERYDGTTGALVGSFGSAQLSSPTGLTFDAVGNLYVASYNDNTIRQFSAAGTFLRTLTSVGLVDIGFGLGGPEQIAIGPGGNLFVANFNSSDVEQYSLATGNPVNGGIFVGGGTGGLAGATGLLFASDGWLYVASNFTDQILRFNGSSGSFLDVFKDANSGIYIEPGFLSETPEPASAAAIAFGLAGLAILFRRKAATAPGRR